ncbi:hypothetical protein LDENG_00239010 [Lucifuga dentata]|nr:hypothetical protein LDENG_00239010 [Lucifuga dentata]
MPVAAMAEPAVDHQKRFQAAVDVIHNLPKNGCYRPSYEVMLRFYSLYKQAVCGPCTVSRPAFWDPVGRYKWDAWSRLGGMSSESAMAAYVDEMKKVAQEVIDTVPMNEKTSSLFHYFEPLYTVIDDMPRPAALAVREGLKDAEQADSSAEMRKDGEDEEQEGLKGETSSPQEEFSLSEIVDLSIITVPHDVGVSEGLVLTSDSENEIFCDSVDSVEQLSNIKVPAGFLNGHVSSGSSPVGSYQLETEARQVGAGKGGEGAEDGKGQRPIRRSRDAGQEGSHSWRERGVSQGSPRRPGRGSPVSGGGAGRRGGDGSEGGAERLHDAQLQQQIILALQRLREDMKSVMDRLEVVERLAATHVQGSECRSCPRCDANASEEEMETWWPFDMSGRTVFLLLLWPFVAQGLMYLLGKVQRRSRISS